MFVIVIAVICAHETVIGDEFVERELGRYVLERVRVLAERRMSEANKRVSESRLTEQLSMESEWAETWKKATE